MDNSFLEHSHQNSLHGSSTGGGSNVTTRLNTTLRTEYVDVGEDKTTFYARSTAMMTSIVGRMVSPKTLLIFLRILKAMTFSFLILNIAADLMYITFLHILASSEVRQLVGGRRDMIIRVYGLMFAVIAFCIELDISQVVQKFSGLKGFIPRGLLLFLISAITGSHPINENQVMQQDDDVINDDEFANVTAEIPDSAVVFQMATSFILGLCAITYFLFGICCLDRLTSKAFLSTNNPVRSTAIPIPSAVQTPSLEQYDGPV